VLGVDVGYSTSRASSAVCRLDWDGREIRWTVQRFRAVPEEQERVLRAVAGSGRLEAAAFDGPLRASFDLIGRYRTAERMLTRRLQPWIGKPGQASAPVGMNLNTAANACVRIVLQHCDVAPARHAVRIDSKAVVEAFPSAFMGVMLEDPSSLSARREDRSDIFFQHLARTGGFQRLLEHLLPGRSIALLLEGVTNHDDRAALVCAFTALAVAADDFVAVGDQDGWIMLPPHAFLRGWAFEDLQANASEEDEGSLFLSKPESSPNTIRLA
jgi:hypothetical protein